MGIDIAILKGLFNLRGIEYTEEQGSEYYNESGLSHAPGRANETLILVYGGYAGFYSKFTFIEGKLISVEAYE